MKKKKYINYYVIIKEIDLDRCKRHLANREMPKAISIIPTFWKQLMITPLLPANWKKNSHYLLFVEIHIKMRKCRITAT